MGGGTTAARSIAVATVCLASLLFGTVPGAQGVKEKWDRQKACEGCKWLHAKLRIDYDAIETKVRVYGGGFKSLSRSERAGKAVDGWCDRISTIIYNNDPPVGHDDVFPFTPSSIHMLQLQCKKLQEKYRLAAVSLLSSLSSTQDVPLSILCRDECFVKKKKPDGAGNPSAGKTSSKGPVPSDSALREYSVKQLKQFIGAAAAKRVTPTKQDLLEAALAEAARQRAKQEPKDTGEL
eukprot:Rhum_TRINITY_DN22920_c0_g1::Rhum_TRINITY_DN22920_c0_g1_i1::g.176474::m.176474